MFDIYTATEYYGKGLERLGVAIVSSARICAKGIRSKLSLRYTLSENLFCWKMYLVMA
jgi:hypothetical protein